MNDASPNPPVHLAHGDVRAEIVPARGALVSALSVGDIEVLYLDRATLDDPSKNVRGGIPVLFPFAGAVPEGRFEPAGTQMRQHGFGRDKAWRVVAQRPDAVWLRLAQDTETQTHFPYAFEADYAVRLLPRGLQVELTVEATGARGVPLSPGWHPYFCCPADAKSSVTGTVPGLRPEAFTEDAVFDFGLEAPISGRTMFEVPGLGHLRLEASPELRHLQFWSQPGKPFICLEPFFGPAGTVNTDRRLELAPGRAVTLWMRIEVEA